MKALGNPILKWAACLALAVSACTYPQTRPQPAPLTYRALGQEPGWTLTIAYGLIDYVGDYGETRITAPRPNPRPTANGYRYETPRLTVDVSHGRCNDAMSGRGYSDRVMIVADGRPVQGCGGERRPDWDI